MARRAQRRAKREQGVLMARTLYRIFLYFVVTVMLGFAAFSLGSLLTTLLRLTALRGNSPAPTGSELVQTTVLAAIGVLFFLALGGLFYWLIRRDIAQEPDAARGAVRSLFLNLAQAVAAVLALIVGLIFFQNLGQPYAQDASGPVAIILVAAGVFILEQFERRRSAPAPGAAMVLQRLHLYGVQIIVLLVSMTAWYRAIDTTVRVSLAALHLIPDPCFVTPAEGPPAPFTCPLAGELLGLWLAVVWTVAIWGLYIWLARGDTRSVLRKVAQFAGFIIGLINVLIGVELAVELGLRSAFGLEASVPVALATSFDFFQTLLFGVVAMAVYGIWLMSEAAETPLGQQGTELTTLSLAAITLGVPFYVAIVRLLYTLGESAITHAPLDTAAIAAALGWLVAGLAHPFIAYELRRRTTADVPFGPRRGFVLAGLAAGALAGTIGGGIALYLLVTALLGSPLTDWPVNARLGAEVFLVGAYVAGIHLWRMVAEQKLMPHRERPAPAAHGAPGAIEAVLDDLLAGRITRDQAAARLRDLLRA
jgi:hypothetical protein